MYTMQEAFDIAARGVIGQGGPSIDVGMCVYRSANGRKCAAGHLISDQSYRDVFEGQTIGKIWDKISEWDGLKPTFLSFLQKAHDENALPPDGVKTDENFISGYKVSMRAVAERFNLDAKVLDENISDKVHEVFGAALTPTPELVTA